MKLCSVDGCKKPHHSHSYCTMHRCRLRRGKPFGDPIGYNSRRSAVIDDELLEERLREAVRLRLSDAQAGERLGVSARTVMRWRGLLGLTGRPPGVTVRSNAL